MAIFRTFLVFLVVITPFCLSAPIDNLTVTPLRSEDPPLCPAVAECLSKLDRGKKCDTLPIPERAKFNFLPTGYILNLLRPGVWRFHDGGYSALIVMSGSRIVVADFPESADADGLPFIVNATTTLLNGVIPTQIDMILSHSHYDHIGGAKKFFVWAKRKYPAASIVVYGTHDTKRMIKRSLSKRAPMPNVIVGEGGRTQILLRKGLRLKIFSIAGHTAEDLVVHVVPTVKYPGVVLFVDVVFPRWAPYRNLAITTNVYDYVEVHYKLLKLDFKYFIGGHVGLGTKRDVRDNLRFSEDLIEAARTSIASLTPADFAAGGIGKAFDPSKVEFGNIWYAILDVVRKLQADGCVRTMLKKYGCYFGGVDKVIAEHCFTAVTYVVLED